MELTRRQSTADREETWHIYYGGIRVGMIGIRRGVRVDVDQWGWHCGFYPLSHSGKEEGRKWPQPRISIRSARLDRRVSAARILRPVKSEARAHGPMGLLAS